MARPKKDPSLLMDVDIRIPVTREQKAMIFNAAVLSQSELAAWVRPIILRLARKAISDSERRKKKTG